MASLVTTTINGTLTGNSSATFDSTIRSKNQLRVSNDYSVNYFYKTNNTTMLGYLLMRDDNNSFLSFPAAQDFRFLHGNTSRIAVQTDGKVGIGTTAPGYPLHVVGKIYSSTEGQFGNAIAKNNSGVATFGSNSTATTIKINLDASASRNDLVIEGSTGDVGIGTASPAEKLHIGSGASENSNLFVRVDGDAAFQKGFNIFADGSEQWRIYTTASSSDLRFYDGSNVTVTFEDGGNVGIGTTSPNNNLVVSDTVQPSYTPAVAGEYIEIARTSGGDAGFLINKIQDNGCLVLIIVTEQTLR